MTVLLRRIASAFALLLCLVAPHVYADEAPAAEASGAYNRDALEREGFVPVEAGQGETVDGGRLLVAAYAVMWVLVLGYVFQLARRQTRVAADLDDLRKRLAEVDDDLARIESKGAR